MIERAKLVLAQSGRGPHVAGGALIDDLPLFAATRAAPAQQGDNELTAALAALSQRDVAARGLWGAP